MTPAQIFTRLRPVIAAALAGATALSACMVGPDYHGPPNAAPIASAPGAGFVRAPAGAYALVAPPARWWEALNDPELTRLIDMALAASPSLAQAEAKVRSSRAMVSEQRAGLLPTGGASALYAHARVPSGVLGGGQSTGASSSAAATNLDIYSANFDASWEIDLFGGVRRGIENAKGTFQAQEATFQDSQVQLASEVAQSYVNLRDVQARIRLGAESANVETEELALTRQRRAAGTASDGDVERLVSQLSQTKAQNAPLLAKRDQYLDQLALLTGREPGALDAELAGDVPTPEPPASVAIGDPAAMLRRRPDIREAERQLAAANATIGQHVADYFPSLSLFGVVGQSSNNTATLFNSSNFTALGAPSLSWNVFNFPKVAAQVRGAQADRDASIENYRQTVLAALQDAEDSLSTFGHDRETLRQFILARDSAVRAAASTRIRYAAGTASLIDLLDTERQRASAEQSVSQSQAQLTNAFVALQKSLGLGWGAPPPAPRPALPGQRKDRG
jgi:NodT family efflux transporter outer membrane factor (OMF) lipoprotein